MTSLTWQHRPDLCHFRPMLGSELVQLGVLFQDELHQVIDALSFGYDAVDSVHSAKSTAVSVEP